MPTWEFEELKLANEGRGESCKLEDDILISRYDRFGGIPRNIWCVTKEPEQLLKDAISSAKLDDIISVASNKQVEEKHYSHRLLKLVPSQPDFRTQSYLMFLCDSIAEELFTELDKRAHQRLLEFALLSGDSSTASLRGKIFEQFAHRSFQSEGTVFSGHSLVHMKEKFTLSVPFGIQKKSFHTISDCFESMNVGKPFYFLPKSKSFASIDSLFWDGQDSLSFLQMTVGQKHGIVHKVMYELLSEVSKFKEEKILVFETRFVFVVPKDVIVSFQEQNYLCGKKKVSNPYKIVSNVEQYVVECSLK
jgi:hypothetical protein